jgi:TDG/mug DNA glycosylase family protein
VNQAVLPDVLPPGLLLVLCGSAAGNVSAKRGAYYAHPRNRFWRTLHAAGLTPRLLQPEEFRKLPRYGIGLTDLAKFESGGDHQLSHRAYDAERLRRVIATARPRYLAFTGKRPALAYLGRRAATGLQDETIGATRLFVLPSPSPANAGHWDPAPWHELGALVAAARAQISTGNG